MSRTYIEFEEANCKNCLRCVRVCPTNALTYLNHQVKVLEDECILCGECYRVCPHSAKKVHTDLDLVKQWLKDDQQVILSVAPSFIVVWPKFNHLKKLLINRGFFKVLETAHGAKLVSEQYAQLIKEEKMDNIITTCCPAVCNLIEKEFGDLVPLMAPIVSPMIAHGKNIKEHYPQAKVVFLSPCIAKGKEAKDERFANYIDATISMEDVFLWIKDDLKANESEIWQNFEGEIARYYPLTGGILKTLPDSTYYKKISIDGIDRIKTVLKDIQEDKLHHYFLELSSCVGSCIEGPLIAHFKHNQWQGIDELCQGIKDFNPVSAHPLERKFKAIWQDEKIMHPTFSEQQIKDVLFMMGKSSKKQELNCGGCGYETCRQKAIAVLEGKADPNLCLPQALEHAESLASVIVDHTPNGILVVDQELKIKEINPSAQRMLNVYDLDITGMPLIGLLPNDELIKYVQATEDVQYYRCDYPIYSGIFEHAILKITNGNYYVIILMDLTIEETKDRLMNEYRQKTMSITQQVIDDQMRTVQEIASLLGETTAKSKVALTKLQKAMNRHE